MTKKRKICLILVIITLLLSKEEIYAFLHRNIILKKINDYNCEVKNKTLEDNYNSLINMYKFDDNIPYNITYSKVLFRDVYSFSNIITIYKGNNDKILKDNLVINDLGLIGLVKNTFQNSSEVILLTNEDITLSVKINDVYGILKYKNNKLFIDGITNNSNINIGDKIYTSDLSKYPSNILVGKVKNIETNKYEIEKTLEVEAAVDFNNIKYVGVITDLRGQE